jgi:hypothetical protein
MTRPWSADEAEAARRGESQDFPHLDVGVISRIAECGELAAILPIVANLLE